jgi:hypothetical protein
MERRRAPAAKRGRGRPRTCLGSWGPLPGPYTATSPGAPATATMDGTANAQLGLVVRASRPLPESESAAAGGDLRSWPFPLPCREGHRRRPQAHRGGQTQPTLSGWRHEATHPSPSRFCAPRRDGGPAGEFRRGEGALHGGPASALVEEEV